jgi:hypothetical protein
MNPAAPAQAAHPVKKRRRLMPGAAQPTGILGPLGLGFISFSFPLNLSLPRRRLYLQQAVDVKKRRVLRRPAHDELGGLENKAAREANTEAAAPGQTAVTVTPLPLSSM